MLSARELEKQDNFLNSALFKALALHVAIALLLLLASLFKPAPPPEPKVINAVMLPPGALTNKHAAPKAAPAPPPLPEPAKPLPEPVKKPEPVAAKPLPSKPAPPKPVQPKPAVPEKPVAPPKPQPAPKPEAKPLKPEPKPIPKAEPAKTEPKPVEKPPEKKLPKLDARAADDEIAQIEKESAAIRQKQQQEAAIRRQAEEDARIRAEAEQIAAAQRSSQEGLLVGRYTKLIQDRMKRFWNLPSCARKGMTVTLRINLAPGGDVLNATTLQSSGCQALDLSAEQAVLKARPLPVPSDPGVFDRNFRTIRIKFSPEDL